MADVNTIKIAVLETKLENLQNSLSHLHRKIDSISEKVSANVPCPAPGMCITIKAEQEKQEEQITALIADKNRRMGERTILVGVASAVGSGISMLLSWLSKN